MELDTRTQAFKTFMNEFVRESDRAAVILGAAKMEALLGAILDRYLMPHAGSRDELLEGDSPLCTFSARINICHRLGIIDTHFAKLLHTFRRLRNSFAHEIDNSDLTVGAARDRVISMAEPFAKSGFYQGLLEKIASHSKRLVDEPGVVFRAVLSIFYLELESIRGEINPIESRGWDGIVETASKLENPNGGEGES
jgi:hypothetical protein